VIELLLTLATPRKDCKTAAKVILKRFKSLQGVFEASQQELCKVDGIGPKNVLGIKLIKAVSERYLASRLERKNALNSSKELFDFLYHTLRDRQRECFQVVYMDAKNRVVGTEILFEGTLTASAIYPREVVLAALKQNAAALIFVHNHPSGDPKPSGDDISITRQLVLICRILGITVHEHLVIGNNTYFSFADKGYIAQMNREAVDLLRLPSKVASRTDKT
jgi:DNA repair protein RadC